MLTSIAMYFAPQIFQLESQLGDTCKQAGLPLVVPSGSTKELSMPSAKAQKPREFKPVDTSELSEISDTEIDSPDAASAGQLTARTRAVSKRTF